MNSIEILCLLTFIVWSLVLLILYMLIHIAYLFYQTLPLRIEKSISPTWYVKLVTHHKVGYGEVYPPPPTGSLATNVDQLP